MFWLIFIFVYMNIGIAWVAHREKDFGGYDSIEKVYIQLVMIFWPIVMILWYYYEIYKWYKKIHKT